MEDLMPIDTWLIFLLGFMILGSIVALEIKDILSSIVALGVVGLAVSTAFLLLQAPDLAIVQFLFEIFFLIILFRAFLGKGYHDLEPARLKRLTAALTVMTLIAVYAFSVHVFKGLPEFGRPILSTGRYYLENAGVQVKSANIVSAVILDYRAYDTLGELTVLFTAILGTFTILRIRKAKKEGGSDDVR
jgi:multicomponent Na+:H+ antiporter subunit B